MKNHRKVHQCCFTLTDERQVVNAALLHILFSQQEEKMGTIIFSPWEYEMKPFQITDNLWYVGNKDVAVHVLDTHSGLILFDTGYPQTAYMLLESIREAGFDPHDIKYILHTHMHYDHIGATRRLVEKYGCKTFVGRGDADFLTEKTELLWHREYGAAYHEYFHPDVLLDDEDIVELGDSKIRCIAAPGHTPGTMCYFFETEYKGERYTAALHGGLGLNTLSSEYMGKHGITGWREAYRETIEKLRPFRVDITLGAHPVFNAAFEKNAKKTNDFNPFIDSGEWQIMLSDARARYEDLIRKDPLDHFFPGVYSRLNQRMNSS